MAQGRVSRVRVCLAGIAVALCVTPSAAFAQHGTRGIAYWSQGGPEVALTLIGGCFPGPEPPGSPMMSTTCGTPPAGAAGAIPVSVVAPGQAQLRFEESVRALSYSPQSQTDAQNPPVVLSRTADLRVWVVGLPRAIASGQIITFDAQYDDDRYSSTYRLQAIVAPSPSPSPPPLATSYLSGTSGTITARAAARKCRPQATRRRKSSQAWSSAAAAKRKCRTAKRSRERRS